MDFGGLVLAFLLLLLLFAVLDGRVVIMTWSFSFLALPWLRSKVGVVSVYWCDVAAVVACFVCLRWPPNEPGQRLTKWYLLLGAVHLLGLITSFVRYDAILEPGYETLRYGVAFLPLVLLPRVAHDRQAMGWFWYGVVASAIAMVALALIQTYQRDLAFDIGTYVYGRRSDSATSPYHERVLMDATQLRVYGMYSASTCFAGAATLTGGLLAFRISQVKQGLILRLSLLGTAATMLLTFSRHGLLAWGAMLLPTFVHKPRRGALLPLMLIGLVGLLGAGEFWAERINRGGVEDDSNLSSRLVDRPLELLERIADEPSILLSGVGLGTDHIEARDPENGPSRVGFVSNGFALYLFYLGLPALLLVVALLAATVRLAWQLEAEMRAAALGGLAATIVVIASDNYGFLHTSFPFMWSVLVALISAYSEVGDAAVESEGAAGGALLAR